MFVVLEIHFENCTLEIFVELQLLLIEHFVLWAGFEWGCQAKYCELADN